MRDGQIIVSLRGSKQQEDGLPLKKTLLEKSPPKIPGRGKPQSSDMTLGSLATSWVSEPDTGRSLRPDYHLN